MKKKDKNRDSFDYSEGTGNIGSGKKKKKKGMSCCGCLGIFCLVFVLIIGAGVGVGCYYADSYLKANFDLSLGETIGVVNELYRSNRDKVVTNAPTEEDEKGFYNAVGKQLYLKDGTLTKESFAAISGSLAGSGKENNGNGDGEEPIYYQMKAVRRAAQDGDAETSLSNLICRDNMDIARIKGKFTNDYNYSENYADDFVITLTDKQILALMRELITSATSEGESAEIMKYFTLEQMTLGRSEEDKPVISIVINANVKGIMENNVPSDNWMIGIALNLMPKELYLTASIELGDNLTGDIRVNAMDEKKHANFHKLLTGVLKLMGEEGDSHSYINKMLNDYAGEVIKQADEYMHFDENVGEGTIKFDLFSALAQTLFAENDMSGQELAMLYTSVLSGDSDKMLENNKDQLFENIYRNNTTGEEVYSVAPVTGAKLVNYGNEFTEEFSRKYLINTEFFRDGDKIYFAPAYKDKSGKLYLSSELKFIDGDCPRRDGVPVSPLYRLKDDGNWVYPNTIDLDREGLHYEAITCIERVKLEFADIAALMGLGESNKIEGIKLETLFNPQGLTQTVGGNNTNNRDEWFVNQSGDDLKFVLNERMLAALIDAQTKSVIGSEGALTDSLKLRFVALSEGEKDSYSPVAATSEGEDEENESGEDEPTENEIEFTHKYMTVGFEINTRALFDGVDVISGLLGERVGLTVKLDITLGVPESKLSAPIMTYCDFSNERTDRMIATLNKMGMEFFNAQALNDQLGKPIRNALETMSSTLGEVVILNGKCEVPNVFELLSSQMFPYDEDKTFGDPAEPIVLTGEELHKAFKGMYNLLDIEEKSTMDENTGNDIIHHYLVNNEGTYTGVYTGVGEAPLGEGEEYAVRDNDTETVNKINMLIEGDTTNQYKLSEDLDEVVGYYNGDDGRMYLTYRYTIAPYMSKTSGDANMLTIDSVYATFMVYKDQQLTIGGETAYKVKLIINDMSDEDRILLEKMMVYSDPSNIGRFADLEEKIGVFAYKLDQLNILEPSVPIE